MPTTETISDDKRGIKNRGLSNKSRQTGEQEKGVAKADKTSVKPELTEDEKKEYELLKASCRKDSGEFKDAADYVEFRNSFFGSAIKYEQISKTADDEFDRLNQDYIGGTEHQAFKKVLYRWTREAFKRKKNKDEQVIGDEIAQVFRSKITPDLKKKISDLGNKYIIKIDPQFVFRPQKLNGKYTLGTISEHAQGTAIDINPDNNPQLTSKEWNFLAEYTGKTIDKSKARWQSSPEDLWQDIYDLNERFKSKFRKEVKVLVQMASLPLNGTPTPEEQKIVEGLLNRYSKKYKNLIDAVRKNTIDTGFFTLDRNLVIDLKEQGLTWGITFPNPDLHHFELSGK